MASAAVGARKMGRGPGCEEPHGAIQSNFDVLQSEPNKGALGVESRCLSEQAREHARMQGRGLGEAEMGATCAAEGKTSLKDRPNSATKRTRAKLSSLPRSSSEEARVGARKIIKKTLRRSFSEERPADPGLPPRRCSGRLANNGLDGATKR